MSKDVLSVLLQHPQHGCAMRACEHMNTRVVAFVPQPPDTLKDHCVNCCTEIVLSPRGPKKA